MSPLDDLSHPIFPTPLHWIAPSPWMPDVQSFPSFMSLTNNSIWKTPFPPLHTSNHPEQLRVNVAASRKPLLNTNQESSFACLSISHVSITHIVSIFYVISPVLSKAENKCGTSQHGERNSNISKAISGRNKVCNSYHMMTWYEEVEATPQNWKTRYGLSKEGTNILAESWRLRNSHPWKDLGQNVLARRSYAKMLRQKCVWCVRGTESSLGRILVVYWYVSKIVIMIKCPFTDHLIGRKWLDI